MGNQFTCMNSKSKSVKESHLRLRNKSLRELKKLDEERLVQQQQQQALIMALCEQKVVSKGQLRAMSQRYSDTGPAKQFARTSSVRPRSMIDQDMQFLKDIKKDEQVLNLASLETRHFVLVHGGGYGAWCWYKSIALLEESGFVATAIDLTGSGIEPTDPNTVTSLSQYAKPLFDYLEKLPADEKVVLVGHDVAGACVSFAMERFTSKIAKAVFVVATMVMNGQSALDAFSPEAMTADDLLPKAQVFAYGNGSSSPPTSVGFHKDLVKDLLFNRTPAKDYALATVSLRPVPFAPVREKLSLTENYGQVRRFFVEASDDNALTPALQERMVTLNPPERTFKLKGSDHSPFLSKPQSLHKVLVEIAQLSRYSSGTDKT